MRDVALSPAAVLTLLLTAPVLAACGHDGNRTALSVDTTADGRVVVSNGPAAGESLRLVETLRIGKRQGTGPPVFGEISGVATDPRGRIYVAETFAHEVRAFDAEGRHLWSSGREGEGPGQFRMISGLAWHPDGELWVRDPGNGRLTVLDTAGELLRTQRRERGRLVSIPWTGRVDASGRLYEKEAPPGEESGKSVARYRLDAEGELVLAGRTPVPELEVPHYTRRGEGFVERSPLPFSPEIRWAVGPGGDLWYASTGEYRLHRMSADGDTLRTVELRRSPPTLTGEERDSVAAATGLSPDRLPEEKPVFRWFTVDEEGRLWVRTRRPDGTPAWDVFRSDGRYLGAARPEAELFGAGRTVLPAVRNGTVVGVTRDEAGVPFVVRMRLQRPDSSLSDRSG